MASFQVEIVPFFQNNLNNLDLGDLWVHQPQWQTASSDATPQCSNNNKNNNNNNESTYAYADKQCKDKWARAREIVFPANANAKATPSDNPNTGGVSSLVQKWRGFERGAPPPPPLPPAPLAMDDDSIIGDWESDRTVLSGRSSIRGRDSDATESERLRVVDIIRKLTPNEAGSVSPPRIRTSLDQSDLRSMISPSPRIRGRQAYLDLLAQRERDRRKEIMAVHARKSVSKFSHRGRIQAVLKLKLLRRGIEGGHSNTIPFEPHIPRPRVNQKGQSSSTVHFEKEPKENTTNDQVRKQEKRCNGKSCLRAQEDVIRYEETTYIRQEGEEASKSKESNKHKEEDDGCGDQGCSNQLQMVETAAYWVADFAHPEEGWEELQSREANNTDWIEQVSRPRSDWEYLRQERYQEMLDPFAENEEIRLLLCRKSVSNFLSSGMRDKIDQLMICRSQGDKKQVSKGGEEGEYFYEYEQGERQQFVECDEYVVANNQNEKQKQNQAGQEPSECSYQAASPTTQQSSTNYCSQSQDMTGRNSYGAHPTFEMEIIYDLRRHMEQLHQEISELRKSIKCCTDMQIKVHRSIKKEVAAALIHPDAKNGRRHPVKRGTNNGRRCCVCRKGQVDCVLYRCGHMCTCFDCANQLHWSSGRCPICTAQIVDVVRTHSNF